MRGEKGMNETTAPPAISDYAIDITGRQILYEGKNALPFDAVFSDVLIWKFLLPIAIFALLFAIDFFGSRVRHRAAAILSAVPALCLTAGLLFYKYTTGSNAISHLALAFVMTATVFIFHFVKLSFLDYTVMFSCFFCVVKFIGVDSIYFGAALPTLFIFVILLVICRIRLKRLRGHLFHVWFASMLTAMEGYGFRLLYNRIVTPLGYARDSNIEKLFVWGIATLIFVAINLALIYGIKKLFQKRFDEINRMGKAYPKIERFFIINSIAILLLMMLLLGLYYISRGYDSVLLGVVNLFSLLALIIQVSFLVMIYRITWLKDSLKSKALENQSLAAYSFGLEENMAGIRKIKHDIKNIFLTMGRFVEQSGDLEIQTFYREKINPFAIEEIAKSDLYGKLAAINNEQLKAFLFYKISQAVERGIDVDLDILPQLSIAEMNIEFTDLVRVLGILMDNAIEECMELTRGVMSVKISGNNMLISYIIKNTVSPERKANGIRPGVTSKVGGRGNGLLIVRDILEQYTNAILNSYFQDDCFVQNLVLYVGAYPTENSG